MAEYNFIEIAKNAKIASKKLAVLSTDVKNKALLEAEFLGYILTGNTTNNEEYLEFITENEFNIERFYRIL